MRYKDIRPDEETLRSCGRAMYGHEMWLEGVERDGDTISVRGLYGHKMLPDKPMPTDYANAVLFGDDGRASDPEREIVRKPSGWRFSFRDEGAKVYTLYVDSNSVWLTNDEGWHRGTRRDYEKVTYCEAFNMAAKRIVSRDGKDPGDVMHLDLEIMPERATLEAGREAVMGIFYEGRPMKGLKCIVYNRGWQDLKTIATCEDGKLRFAADLPGTYVIIAKYTDTGKSSAGEFDETGYSTTLTIEA